MKKLIIIVVIFLFGSYLYAKSTTRVTTITPNISVSYDSTVFKLIPFPVRHEGLSDRVSFRMASDSIDRRFNIIGFAANAFYPSNLDSSMLSEFGDYLKTEASKEDFIEYDRTLRHINGFSCYGVIIQGKESKEYHCYIIGRRYTGKENMDIMLESNSSGSLAREYDWMKRLLGGVRFK